MYPKWLAKGLMNFETYGYACCGIYLEQGEIGWADQNGYRIFGIADLHREALYAVTTELIRTLCAPYTVFTFLPVDACEKKGMEQVRFGVDLTGFGENQKAWERSRKFWNGLFIRAYAPLPEHAEKQSALAWLEKSRAESVFEICTTFAAVPSGRGRNDGFAGFLNGYSLNLFLPNGLTQTEHWRLQTVIASVLERLEVDAEWYVDGKNTDAAKFIIDDTVLRHELR